MGTVLPACGHIPYLVGHASDSGVPVVGDPSKDGTYVPRNRLRVELDSRTRLIPSPKDHPGWIQTMKLDHEAKQDAHCDDGEGSVSLSIYIHFQCLVVNKCIA